MSQNSSELRSAQMMSELYDVLDKALGPWENASYAGAPSAVEALMFQRDDARQMLKRIRQRAVLVIERDKIEPTFMFNGGNGAVLCFLCGAIARTGRKGPLAEVCPDGKGCGYGLEGVQPFPDASVDVE